MMSWALCRQMRQTRLATFADTFYYYPLSRFPGHAISGAPHRGEVGNTFLA
jgi:hypothetical protein